MKALIAILDEVGFSHRIDGERILVGLPDGSEFGIAAHGGNPMLHITLPPSAEKLLKHSFDMTPTLVGDYLVDTRMFRKLAMTLPDQLESKPKKMARKDIAAFAADLKKMTATEQKSEGVKRIGQDKLRTLLLEQYGACQLSDITQRNLLVASHIKPWGKCKDGPDERLDPENVLLLAANWDALFDRLYITFDATTGAMKKSTRISEDDLRLFGVPADWQTSVRILAMTDRRRAYLKAHNDLMKAEDSKCDGIMSFK